MIWAGEKPVKSSRRATPTKRRVRRVTSSHTAKHHSFLRGGGHVGTPEGADVRGCALRVERGLCAGVHVLQIRLDLLEGQLVQPVVVDCAPLRGGIAAHVDERAFLVRGSSVKCTAAVSDQTAGAELAVRVEQLQGEQLMDGCVAWPPLSRPARHDAAELVETPFPAVR